MALLTDRSCDSPSDGARSETKERKRGARRTRNVKPRTKGEYEKIKIWKLADISNSGDLQALGMPDKATTHNKVG